MQDFPGAVPDMAHLHSSLLAIEQACSFIQMHANPIEAEKIILSLRQSSMPYQTCRFILEKSQVANARFQAASAIGDAAIREWGILTVDNKKSLILFCLHYAMEHASAADAYVQSKVSAVAAQLVKRSWLDFPETEKLAILFEVKQGVLGVHGPDVQTAGIHFLESLVSEFSPATSSSLGLPKDFHDQCYLSLELHCLKEFYCWAQAAACSVADKVLACHATVYEEKVCSGALRLMFQILNWNFKTSNSNIEPSAAKPQSLPSGIRHDIVMLKKFERTLVQPGPSWYDALLSSGHTVWLLNLYSTLRQKYNSDVIWIDSPLAVSCRQLIVQLCSLSGNIFPSDDGQMQIKHMVQILSAVIEWIEPLDIVSAATGRGLSESEVIDACHALLSMATLTSTMLFDNLLRSVRPFGTIHLLANLTSEVVKANTSSQDDDETWTTEALDILLETWTVIFGRTSDDKSVISAEAKSAASNLFNNIVLLHLKAAAESAFEDDSEADYFHASVSKRDETMQAYSLIARSAVDSTIPFLTKLFSDRFALLSQKNDKRDYTQILEELYWLLLMTGHILTDSGEGETLLIPEALQVGFSVVATESQHPVVTLSWSLINFARQSLEPEIRNAYFSPRLMEAVIWFLARWAETYLMPLDSTQSQHGIPGHGDGQDEGNHISKKILLNFCGQNNEGHAILNTIVQISTMILSSYLGENELQALTCRKLLSALVRRKHVCAHLVTLDSWNDLARAFANEKALFSLPARLQRSLAETLVCAASSIKDSEASNQYVRLLMGPMSKHLVDISSRNDLKAIGQQADAIYMVSCLLERLRGASRASQPRTQKAIFEMGFAIMNSLLVLLEVYKNQSSVVYLILKFVVDFVEGEVIYLEANETVVLVNFCLQLLQIYSAHNIGKISVSLSTTLRSDAQAEKYKDLRALLQLLMNICSKDLVDFSSSPDEADSPDIAEVIYVGIRIVTPLITLDLLKYPKLCRDYFALISHLLEVYPEKVAQLDDAAFSHIVRTLDFGFRHQDVDIVDKCLRSVNALASYHYKEKTIGKEGLGAKAMSFDSSKGEFRESLLSYFLRLLLQFLLYEDFRMDLSGSAADALLPLVLCEQDVYQRLLHELVERQQVPALKTRLASAFYTLTNSNELSSSLDRPNRFRFRKNLQVFLTEVSGFMRII